MRREEEGASTAVPHPHLNRAGAQINRATAATVRSCRLPACLSGHLPAARPTAGAGTGRSAAPAGWPRSAAASPRPSALQWPRTYAPAPLDWLAAESKSLGLAGVVDGPIIGAGRATQAQAHRRYDDEVLTTPGTCAHTEPPTHTGPAASLAASCRLPCCCCCCLRR